MRLVFYTKDERLKVRLAWEGEVFERSFRWKDKLEFMISPVGDFMMLWTSLLPDLDPLYAEALVELVGARFPISKHFETLKKECPDFVFTNNTHEWVFFGGTFDPWHQGHQSCIDLLPEEKVCLILPDRNPQKDLRQINPVITVLEISRQARFKKNQFLVPTFLFDEKTNPTIEWIRDFKKDFPKDKISLLMGFDSFKNLPTWIQSEELLSIIHCIFVVSRLESEIQKKEALEKNKIINKNLEIIFLGRHDYEEMSSTEIRKKNGRI